jgi:hypothetical protein
MAFAITLNQTTGFGISLQSAPPSTTGEIKVYTGSGWTAKPMKVWNGSSWVTKPVKRWNGTSWVETSN